MLVKIKGDQQRPTRLGNLGRKGIPTNGDPKFRQLAPDRNFCPEAALHLIQKPKGAAIRLHQLLGLVHHVGERFL